VARNPSSANAYDSLADAYMAAGDKAKAKAASEKALELLASDTSMEPRRKEQLKDALKKKLDDLAGSY